MKKSVAAISVAVLIASLTGCGHDMTHVTPSYTPAPTVTPTPTPTKITAPPVPVSEIRPIGPRKGEVYPGIRLKYVRPDGHVGLCTMGAAVYYHLNTDGIKRDEELILTAAHCGGVGAEIYVGATGAHVGTVVAARYHDEEYGSLDDTEAIRPNPGFPVGSMVDNRLPVRAISLKSTAFVGDRFCAWGATSGEICGKYTSPRRGRMEFDFKAAPGDSGGPIYKYHEDGSVSIIGGLQSIDSAKNTQVTTGVDYDDEFTRWPGMR